MPPEKLTAALEHCLETGQLETRTLSAGEYIYLPDLLAAEEAIAARLAALARRDKQTARHLDQDIQVLEAAQGFAYAPEQREAIRQAVTENCLVLTGGPGTGKTTIARLVARYLKAIGALRGGQLVEVSRGDLVGRYTGHTAPLTNSVIESALGGVLFIDEAYSLYRGEQDSFGLEAIDTLVKGMEDHREDLVVILAGYTREMEQFLTANSGLASRFPNQIEFPDYTADQLLDITASLAAARGYRLDDSCTFPLLGYYQRRQAADSRTAGNGRLARNTLEKAIYNQSRRLVAEPDAPLDLIQAGDLEFDE